MNIFKASLLISAIGLGSAHALSAKEVVKLKIKEDKVACSDNASNTCLKVKEGCKSWKTLSSHIEGFNYVEGTKYTIKAKKKDAIANTANSANNNKYELVSIVSQKQVHSGKSTTMKAANQNTSISNHKLFIKKVNGQALAIDDAFLMFNTQENRFHGNNGCNVMNGGITVAGNKVTFSNMISTMRGCMNDDIQKAESLISSALNGASYTYHQVGTNVWLADANGKKVVEMEEQNAAMKAAAVMNKKWELITLNNVGKDYNGVFINFDTGINKVTGNTSCNAFNSEMKVDGTYITIGKIMMTMKGCLGETGDNETAFFNAMNDKTFTYEVDNTTLTLYRENKTIAIFKTVK